MAAGGAHRPRFWRSGRIVRVRTPNTPGGILMIPRFHRGGRRVRGGTILPERHFPRTIRGSSPVIATPRTRTTSRRRGQRALHHRPASPHAHNVPLLEVRAATTRTRSRTRTTSRTRTAAAGAGGGRDADPAGRTTDRGVLHIGGRLPRGPTPGFPHDSAVLPGTSVFSERTPMCRQGLSAHGRISTALNAGEFPHDSADPPPTGSDRMCSTAPTGPMPHIRTRQHRPDTAETTGAAPGCAKRAAAPPRPPPSPPGRKNTTPGDSTVCYAPSHLLRPFTLHCTRKGGVAEGKRAYRRRGGVVDDPVRPPADPEPPGRTPAAPREPSPRSATTPGRYGPGRCGRGGGVGLA